MKPTPFRHYAPTTVDAAIALLARLAPPDARVRAGGQSLVPSMAFRLEQAA
jgi:carbon-monoxide dehydrogenase medium subunit